MTRLNRYLSSCGLGSRRGCEELILNGKVRVNGQLITSLATKVNPGDEVSVRGQKLSPQKILIVALNKPKGYVCTRADERNRQTIYDLLPREYQMLHHIGRLDMDSSGLILLTNDGELSHRLTHPSKGIEKEYEVTVEEILDETVSPKLVKGMMTPEGFAKAERAWLYGGFKLGMVLKQGLKRQIRHMLYQLGHEVRKLERVRIGGYVLKGMALGSWRELKEKEVEKLLEGVKKENDSPTKTVRPKRFGPKDSARETPARPSRTESEERPRRAFRQPRREALEASADMDREEKFRPQRGDKVGTAKRAFKPDRGARPTARGGQRAPMSHDVPINQEDEPKSRPKRDDKVPKPARTFKPGRSQRLDDKPRKSKPKGTRHGGQRTPFSAKKSTGAPRKRAK
jgi:23S rRNA pseudouridine2605 synthase